MCANKVLLHKSVTHLFLVCIFFEGTFYESSEAQEPFEGNLFVQYIKQRISFLQNFFLASLLPWLF